MKPKVTQSQRIVRFVSERGEVSSTAIAAGLQSHIGKKSLYAWLTQLVSRGELVRTGKQGRAYLYQATADGVAMVQEQRRPGPKPGEDTLQMRVLALLGNDRILTRRAMQAEMPDVNAQTLKQTLWLMHRVTHQIDVAGKDGRFLLYGRRGAKGRRAAAAAAEQAKADYGEPLVSGRQGSGCIANSSFMHMCSEKLAAIERCIARCNNEHDRDLLEHVARDYRSL